MRNRHLHAALVAFTEEAGWQLAAATADGAELPFEVIDSGQGDAPLYCYRPLTADFIEQRSSLLGRLAGYPRAVHALRACGNLDAYLALRRAELDGRETHALGTPEDAGRTRAEAALRAFLARVFADSTDFAVLPERVDEAYRELEDALYHGRTEAIVVAALQGLQIGSGELVLGEGLVLVAPAAVAQDLPLEAVAAAEANDGLLAILRWEPAPGDPAPIGQARVRLRRLLLALRLFEAGAPSFGPLGWAQLGGGAWEPFVLAALGHRAGEPVAVAPEQEDELRAFCNLVARRTPRSGEIAWALRRFELACDRPLAGESLTDLLLSLRALLEPEGAESGRAAGRLAALCALPAQRAELARRVAQAVAAERAVIGGLAVDPGLDGLVAELTGHLRALLRDVLCGHLATDLCALADEIAAEDAEVPVEHQSEVQRPITVVSPL